MENSEAFVQAAIIERNIPYLRRYARAVIGEQALGDHYVEVALEAELSSGRPELSKINFFVALEAAIAQSKHGERTGPARRAMLLTAMEEFSLDETAKIMGQSREDVKDALRKAEHEIQQRLASRLLIIEDEPIIAAHINQITESLGHEVVGIADTKASAVELYRQTKPDIILADIRLADNSLGTDAVEEMNLPQDVPVIFITAYPEKLLTTDDTRAVYLITKPFEPDYVKAVISQVLMSGKQKKS